LSIAITLAAGGSVTPAGELTHLFYFSFQHSSASIGRSAIPWRRIVMLET